jgi:hypothetical protein
MKRSNTFLRGFILGWGLGYLFDPRLGKRRRTVARDWTLGRARHGLRRLRRWIRYVASQASGKRNRLRHLTAGPKPQPDDATLAHKVESTVFRDPHVPKGQISINAENGVVYLRGEVPDESLMDDLVAKTRSIEGVVGVENLLHLPGQRAPMHT